MTAPAPDTAPPRFLVLFDFDETIVDESSDDAVLQALPGGGGALPSWLRDSYREGHYNEHMQRVLAYMAEQGVTEGAIRAHVEGIPPVPGLPTLLAFLQARPGDFECAVISDANTYFIEAWLGVARARPVFRDVFTNPASFDAAGRLVLRPHHAHACPRCPANMCKRAVVRGHLARRAGERSAVPFARVFYVGDGANDVCPVLALGGRDVALARRGYPMHRILEGMQRDAEGTAGTVGTDIRPAVVPWDSGHDVIDCLKRALEER